MVIVKTVVTVRVNKFDYKTEGDAYAAAECYLDEKYPRLAYVAHRDADTSYYYYDFEV